MKKRVCSLLLLVMATGLFTSCQPNQPSSSDLPSSSENTSSGESITSELPSSSEEESSSSSVDEKITTVDYFGTTVKLNKHAILVDMHLKDDQLNEFVFNDLVKAAAAIEAGESYDVPTVIYLAKGVYWVDDVTTELDTVGSPTIGLELNKDYIHILGLDKDASKTVIAGNRGNRVGCNENWNVMAVGTGFEAKDITIGNYCNIPLEYPDDPSLNVAPRNSTSITQGQTVVSSHPGCDRWRFENVRFMARLNCIPGSAQRVYFKDCHIECTDDSIQPGTHIVYENCDFDFYGKHPMWGSIYQDISFLGCTFRGKSVDASPFYFSKDPTNLALIDCKFEENFPSLEWCNVNTNYPWMRNYVYNTTMDGKEVTLSPDNKDAQVTLDSTSEALKAYKVGEVYNSYNLLRGEDDWDPNDVKKDVTGAENEAYRATLNIKEGEKTSLIEGESTILVPGFISSKALDKTPDFDINVKEDGVLSVEKTAEGEITVTAADDIGYTTLSEPVEIVTASGLEACCYIEVSPSGVLPPELVGETTINIEAGLVNLNYDLNLPEGLIDESEISWYRSEDETFDDKDIEVATSRYGVPYASYELTEDDEGYFIIAKIAPKSHLSEAGVASSYVTSRAIEVGDITAAKGHIETDFANLSTANHEIKKGYYTYDNHIPADLKEKYYTNGDGSISTKWDEYVNQLNGAKEGWAYGEGFDGALGQKGLTNVGRGARMLYTPLDSNNGKDMSMEVTIAPAKSAGQGFGSAHGQYLDIFIGYDTTTMTGYGLRIERETAFSDACLFGLYSFKDDVATYISNVTSEIEGNKFNGLYAQAYRGLVTVQMKIENNVFTATISSDQESSVDDGYHDQSVSLTANLPADRTISSGFGFMHTGTTSNGNRSTITNIKVDYLG